MQLTLVWHVLKLVLTKLIFGVQSCPYGVIILSNVELVIVFPRSAIGRVGLMFVKHDSRVHQHHCFWNSKKRTTFMSLSVHFPFAWKPIMKSNLLYFYWYNITISNSIYLFKNKACAHIYECCLRPDVDWTSLLHPPLSLRRKNLAQPRIMDGQKAFDLHIQCIEKLLAEH